MIQEWRPRAPLAELRRRAAVLVVVRDFFMRRGVLEVETPLLSRHTVTDPFIGSLSVAEIVSLPKQTTYLQSSPEYAMKRLLSAGSGPIYQICKAFRDDDSSARHNPEFTLLEWYRPEFSLMELMDEVAALLQAVFAQQGQTLLLEFKTYQQVFEKSLGINPHVATRSELLALAKPWLPSESDSLDKKDLLELLFSFAVEPGFKRIPALFVTDYPCSMSALAALKTDEKTGQQVANRFELYLHGIELANGYHELRDAEAHVQRFTKDQQRRAELGLPAVAMDQRLVGAVAEGLPPCSGVALGLDRLLMDLSGASIQEVLTFPIDRA